MRMVCTGFPSETERKHIGEKVLLDHRMYDVPGPHEVYDVTVTEDGIGFCAMDEDEVHPWFAVHWTEMEAVLVAAYLLASYADSDDIELPAFLREAGKKIVL